MVSSAIFKKNVSRRKHQRKPKAWIDEISRRRHSISRRGITDDCPVTYEITALTLRECFILRNEQIVDLIFIPHSTQEPRTVSARTRPSNASAPPAL